MTFDWAAMIASIILLVVLFLVVSALRKLARLEKMRMQAVQKTDEFDAAPSEDTEFPVSTNEARRSAIKSIGERFTLIRKFVIPLAVLLVVLFASIPFLEGAARSYVSIVVGAITVIIGIASRPYVENLISGLVISLGKSVRIGDTVLIDDNYGTIEEINLTYSVIKIWDWRRYVVPNSVLIQKPFINYNLKDDFVWTRVEFYVSYEADIDEIESISLEAMQKSKSLADHGQPVFWLMGMEDNKIRCWLAGWANTPADAWTVGHDTRMELIRQFKSRKIDAHLSNLNIIGDKSEIKSIV